MALVPSISLCLKTGCTKLVFKETTGVYNASTNLGGYGSPNPTTASIVSAVLTITSPNNIVYTIDLFATTFFPTSNKDYEYSILALDLGLNNFEDGEWTLVYTLISNVEVIYTTTKVSIFTCNSACCVQDLLLDIDPNNINSKENIIKIDNYKKAKSFLDTLRYYANCSNLDQFNNIKLILDRLCANNDCKTCK